jgi:Cof subfamily protein (haloacid dehalogenase superfamily)
MAGLGYFAAMVRMKSLQKLKMAAVDLDGTLLGPKGQISPENMQAVQRLQRNGAQVVLASGRHHLNMRRYGAALPGVQWLISCQGGELSSVDRTTVLHREFMEGARVRETSELGRRLGFTVVAYAVDGIFTDATWNADLDFYAALSGYRPSLCSAEELSRRETFKMIWMGNPNDIERTAAQRPLDPTAIEMVRTQASFLELMPVGVSKASALQILARRLNLLPSEIIAFGDGDNDVPMFEWAGFSVAMDHGWPAALKKAAYTTPEGPAETAFARGVDLVAGLGLFDNEGEALEKSVPRRVAEGSEKNLQSLNPSGFVAG